MPHKREKFSEKCYDYDGKLSVIVRDVKKNIGQCCGTKFDFLLHPSEI
jgi:hypothetical protein